MLALLQRRWWPVAAAVASVVVAVAFVKAYPTIGPSTSYTPAELEYLREQRAAPTGGKRRSARAGRVVDREPLAKPARRRRRRSRATRRATASATPA